MAVKKEEKKAHTKTAPVYAVKNQIKIVGAVLELLAKQHCQFSLFGPTFEVNGLDW